MNHVHLPLTPDRLWWPEPWVWCLLGLLALPLLAWFWHRRRPPAIRFSDLSLLRATGGDGPRRWRAMLPVLRLAALAGLIVAVARPQHPDETSQLYAEGIAIQMVVDTSSSMRDLDLSPAGQKATRLDVVRDVFRRFVLGDGELPGRPNDLVGMIRFARYPDSVCPLTLDHKALLDVLGQTRFVERREEDATAIGDALALAVERLKDLRRTSGSGAQYAIKSRIVILLTDGENNTGEIQPEEAGKLAATFGVKVYTILAGTGRVSGWFREPVDDRVLRQIAEATGGRYFHATDRSSLVKIYAAIDQLERTKTEERRFVRWGELGGPLLLAAFICLAAQALLDATWLRKIP